MSKAAPEPGHNMGEPVARIDGRLKVTGEALYASDFSVRNPAFAFFVTSTIARGRINAIDVSDAMSVAGVLDILTHENTAINEVKFSTGGGGATTSWQNLGPEIGHDGQIVAVVVADTFEAAREGAYRTKITYAEEQPSATFDSPGVTTEDASKANASAPRTCRRPATPRLPSPPPKLHSMLSTAHRRSITIRLSLFTTTCVWNDDELIVYEPSQFVFGLKNGVAQKLGCARRDRQGDKPVCRRRFRLARRSCHRVPALIAHAARKLNRPVKLVATRDQGFTIQTYRAETRHRIRMGARRDGKIVGFIHEGQEVTSRPDPYTVAGVEDSARVYHYGAVKTHVTLVHADRNTPGFMRSPPVVPYIYALESAMDELAIKLNMDPIALRRVNDSMTDTMGKQWSSRSLMECYDEAAKAFGWSQRTAKPGSMRDGDWLIGWGCASAVYPTHVGAAAARVRLLADGQGARADRSARNRHRRTHRNRTDGSRTTRHSGLCRKRRDRRHDTTALARRRRIQPDRKLLLGGHEGLRRHTTDKLYGGNSETVGGPSGRYSKRKSRRMPSSG